MSAVSCSATLKVGRGWFVSHSTAAVPVWALGTSRVWAAPVSAWPCGGHTFVNGHLEGCVWVEGVQRRTQGCTVPPRCRSECWMTFCTNGFPQTIWHFHFSRPELVWFVEGCLEFSQHFFQSLGKKPVLVQGWNVERIGIGKACFLFYWNILTHSSHCEKFIGFFSKFIKPQWQMIKGLEGMTYEERLRELNVYSLKKHK